MNKKLPDPVLGRYNAIRWPSDLPHLDRYPYIVVRLDYEGLRAFSIIPVDPMPGVEENSYAEIARIYAIFEDIDLCLVFSPDRCVYVNRKWGIGRSSSPPTGGILVHRTVPDGTVPLLLQRRLYAGKTKNSGEYNGSDCFNGPFDDPLFQPVDAITTATPEVTCRIKKIVLQTMDELKAVVEKEWDGDADGLKAAAERWLHAIAIESPVRFIYRRDLEEVLKDPRPMDVSSGERLFGLIYRAIDVLEYDMKRAGVSDLVEGLMSPFVCQAFTGLTFMLRDSERITGEAGRETSWRRLSGIVFPAVFSSIITLARFSVWTRIAPLYRQTVPLIDAPGGSVRDALRFTNGLAAYRALMECCPVWMNEREGIEVMPSVLIRTDDAEELHSDAGPAVIHLDGQKEYRLHGSLVDKKMVLDPGGITPRCIAACTNPDLRKALIERRF